ncbi:MAG: malate synthase A [Xanthomonadaceae bacterium]|nr:malate synthase A [Xanthomonadaceae bacterium]
MAVAADRYPSAALQGLVVRAPDGASDLLTPAALALLAAVHRRFDARRRELLAARRRRQAGHDAGALPDFRADTAAIRTSDWRVAPIPEPLWDRRVEITGPTERKTVINALNSGARVFMADFEDSTTPTWDNLVDGQRNLRDAVAGTIAYRAVDGRDYRLAESGAVLMVRPRGLHLPERHLEVDGEVIAGAFFDTVLFLFHNAQRLAQRERGPYLYLPKLEAMEEAMLWQDVLDFGERTLGLVAESIKVTVLIETLPAAFQMDEILHALRGRIVALNCGRWDYIFSTIKTLRAHRDRVLPERGQVTMQVPFLRAYAGLLVQTCHRRGALAMGGMAAQIPIRDQPDANAAALAKVEADKLREVTLGHDGTWVAHPGLVAVARRVFDAHMPTSNQLHVRRDDLRVTAADLLATPAASITRAGFEANIEVALRYVAAWLDGNGCVPIDHLMEDAATAEIARAQLWQWLHHADGGGDELRLADGAPIDMALFERALAAHTRALRASVIPGAARIDAAAALLGELTRATELADFLTLPAYGQLE